MSDLINLLPDSLANQIAAGEVVQRPASVVKELLENSVDAGASEIKLIVKEAGRTLIQVIDDGKGMSENDARMCFERHATSKLKSTEDLFNIRTFGFRGEAMASIAAVAQVEMKTKMREEDLGVHICIEGSEIKTQEPVATKDGTNISVKNLFFNVPARRNFLKSNPVELKHVIEEFQRVSLAHPDVSMILMQNDIEVFNLKAGKLSQRIVDVFGKNFQGQLVSCSTETDDVKIWGYIGKPDKAKKTRGDQYFIANYRFIKHPYLHHAVSEGYEGLLQDGQHPFYVLFIEIDPKKIDINVHPTKTEIKFDDERTMYAIVLSAVKQALGTHNIMPSLDFDSNVNIGFNPRGGDLDYFKSKSVEGERSVNQSNWDKPSSFDQLGSLKSFQPKEVSQRESNNQDNWKKLYEGSENIGNEVFGGPIEEGGPLKFESSLNASAKPFVPELMPDTFKTENQMVFQLHHKYIVSQVKSGMMLIDQQTAHERIQYERYLNTDGRVAGNSQQCLFPQTINLSATDYAISMELNDEIRTLGFMIEDFGNQTVVINGVPAGLDNENEKDLFEGLIEQFKINKKELKISDGENLARSLAKRSAIKHGKPLTNEEMRNIVDRLFACENPNYSPTGKTTHVILSMESIMTYFGG